MSNSAMPRRTDHDQRLTDLEIKASFAEDMLDQLNLVIVRQQQDIDLLMHEVRQLKQQVQVRSSDALGQVIDEPPPHY